MPRRPPRSKRTDTLSLHDALPIYPEQPRCFLAEPMTGERGVRRITARLLRGAGKPVELARHRAKPHHLPEQPGIDPGAHGLISRVEDRKSTRLNSSH